MPSRPTRQEQLARADWKKIVCALADYAYRAMGPDTTWADARVMTRTAIKLALDPETEDWDPREETLLMNLGRTLRDIVIAARDQRGDGREAREESPDWSLAKRTYAIAEMRKHIAGPAGLPIDNDSYLRARRRLRRATVDIYRSMRAEKP